MSATETHYECGRCGSSFDFIDCEMCPACGFYKPDFDPTCPACHGAGRVGICLSELSWCEAHPLPGREDVPPDTPESFEVEV